MYRHPLDVKRDSRINEIKFSLASGHISILDYVSTVQTLFILKEEKSDVEEDQQDKKPKEKYPKFDLSEHVNTI